MRYRLVCLDAGFTLLAPRRTLNEALRGLLAEHGHDVTDEALHRAWEVADRWFWDDYHRPENDTWGDDDKIDASWRQYHALMLRELGLEDRGHQLIDTILAAHTPPRRGSSTPTSCRPSGSCVRSASGSASSRTGARTCSRSSTGSAWQTSSTS